MDQGRLLALDAAGAVARLVSSMSFFFILIGILAIGFLIFVHELGHFLAAKWCGVKVERFAIGFGPKLAGFNWGETEYALCAIPLGGYVKMHGDAYEEFEGKEAKGLENMGYGKDEKPESSEPEAPPPPPVDPSRSFLKKSIPQRILIALAGPAFNIGFALLLFVGYHMATPLPEPVAGGVATGSPAELAGIQAGDRIVRIDGSTPRNYEEVLLYAERAVTGPVPLTIQRGENTFDAVVQKPQIAPADDMGQFSWLGIYQPFEARIGRFSAESAAQAAGFKVDDEVIAIDGQPVHYFFQMATIVRGSGGRELNFTIRRGNETLQIAVSPRAVSENGPFLIGVEPNVSRYTRGAPMSFDSAVRSSVQQTLYLSAMIPRVFYQMITQQRSAKELGGPIEIVKQIGHQAEQSLAQVVRLVALISVNLGIVNLFPIPVLDGGHIVMFLMEAVNRKPVSLRVREVMQGFGLVFILGLMVIALYNDIVRNFVN